jgi:hypothetical protein
VIERNTSNAVSALTRFFHDTLVFIVTSWWLYKESNSADERGRFTTIVLGKHLLPLTRSLLRDGQAYYLSVFLLLSQDYFFTFNYSATLILHVLIIILPLLPKPFITPCTLGGPLFVLISNLACHVYRNLVNAKYRDHGVFLHFVDGSWRPDDRIEAGMEMNPQQRAGTGRAKSRIQSGGSSV